MSLKSVFPIIFLVGSAPLAREAAAEDSAGDSGQRRGEKGACFPAGQPLEVKPAVMRIALADRKISFHCW